MGGSYLPNGSAFSSDCAAEESWDWEEAAVVLLVGALEEHPAIDARSINAASESVNKRLTFFFAFIILSPFVFFYLNSIRNLNQ